MVKVYFVVDLFAYSLVDVLRFFKKNLHTSSVVVSFRFYRCVEGCKNDV